MPRPKLPDDEKKGFVLRARTQPSLYYRILNNAQLNGVTLSAEIIHRLEATLTSGVPTQA